MIITPRRAAVLAAAVAITLTAHGPVSDGGRYGAGGGAVCGTDGQCAAYEREVLQPWRMVPVVPTEDGSLVTIDYWR